MKISPACKYLCVLSLLLLFAVLPASAQSYIVTFEGYGGVALATYVGPLPSVTTPTTGVTLNPSGILQVFSSFPNVTATAMQPCNFYVTGVNGISTIVCNQPPATPTTPSWSISFQTVDNGAIASGHPPAGTYVESQALNSFISEVVLGQPQTGEGIQTVTVALATATYSCSGFQAPFDVPLSLKHKTQRAILLKMQLTDSTGAIVTDQTIAGAPPPAPRAPDNRAAADARLAAAPAAGS